MSEHRPEQRRFTRVALDLPVEVHQGGSVWQQRLIDLSLAGAATDQPDVWDAQYNEPFTLIIHIDETRRLELYAYLQHVEAERLGFKTFLMPYSSSKINNNKSNSSMHLVGVKTIQDVTEQIFQP